MEQEKKPDEAVSMDTTEKSEVSTPIEEGEPQSDNVTETSDFKESPNEEGDTLKEEVKEMVTPSGDTGILLLPASTLTEDELAVKPKIPTVNLEALNSVESPDEGLTYDFSIKFIGNLNNTEVSEGKLVVSKMYGLLFGGNRNVQVPFKNIRWITQIQNFLHLSECFVLSYEDIDSSAISYIFFVCPELDSQLTEKILIWKLAETDGSSVMKTKEERDQVLRILQQQPYEIGSVRLGVSPKEASNMNGEAISTNTMVLDLECVSFFLDSVDQPAHQIKFWVEEGEDVVETIRVMQASSKIEIETTKSNFVLENASMQVTNNLKRMRAREKHLFLGIENLLKAVERTPTQLSQNVERTSTSRFNLPTNSEWNESGTFVPPNPTSKIELEMKDALSSLGDKEEFQLHWVVMESELYELLTIGAIQETEIQSGGLDPNNEDHLERALTDVGDQLKESPDLALSRIQAARKLFVTSAKECIQKVFLYEDMELLKMLYYRSLMQ